MVARCNLYSGSFTRKLLGYLVMNEYSLQYWSFRFCLGAHWCVLRRCILWINCPRLAGNLSCGKNVQRRVSSRVGYSAPDHHTLGGRLGGVPCLGIIQSAQSQSRPHTLVDHHFPYCRVGLCHRRYRSSFVRHTQPNRGAYFAAHIAASAQSAFVALRVWN